MRKSRKKTQVLEAENKTLETMIRRNIEDGNDDKAKINPIEEKTMWKKKFKKSKKTKSFRGVNEILEIKIRKYIVDDDDDEKIMN